MALKTPLEGPPRQTHAVFVDSSGRRMQLARRMGLGLGLVLTLCLGGLGVSLIADADVPATPWTQGEARKQSSGPDLKRKRQQRAESRPTAGVPQPGTVATPSPSSAGQPSPPATTAPATPETPTATPAPGNGKAVGKTSPPGQSRRPRQPAS